MSVNQYVIFYMYFSLIKYFYFLLYFHFLLVIYNNQITEILLYFTIYIRF